ncbi:transposase family protein [Streptomyces thermoalcalitolerans]|uniref:Transposase family protein n=2 Tax=Streptomyces thermoalcalitolerans TaxID=65605 RepID=A0ABP4ABW9_9ACTN
MIPYRAMLDVPHEVVEHISWLIYARRCELNSRRRKLGCFRQALLVLVHLRKNETLAQLAAAFGVSTATAGRYVNETAGLLAEHAPSLHQALHKPPPEGFVILDGTLTATDRIRADEPYYSMKHRRHGMNVQVVAAPDGTPLWFSRALPGRTHDLTSPSLRPGAPPARAHGVIQACLSHQLLVLADRACQGAGATVRTPYYGHRDLPEHYQRYNRDHTRLRAPGERAFARLKQWRILRKARCSTNRIGRTVAAIHAIEIAWRSG